MAMNLTRKTIRTNVYKGARGIRTEWYLSHVHFINSFKLTWGRSNPKAELWCHPALGGPFLLGSAEEGDTSFDYLRSEFWEFPPYIGDGSTIVLQVPKGSASVFVELDVDVETKEDRKARLEAQEAFNHGE